MPTSRRNLLTVAALAATGLASASVQAANAPAARAPQNLEVPERLRDHLQALFGDQNIPLTRVTLALPALAENGNSVALGITVDADTATAPSNDAAIYLQKLYVFGERNPLPDIARFEFPAPPQIAQAPAADLATVNAELALAPAADINTRVRLSDSQRIIAIAQYSDGTLAAGQASIVVTLAACIDLSE